MPGAWSDMSASQGTPKLTATTGSWDEARKEPPTSPPSKGVRPCQHLDVRLLAFRTMRKYVPVVLSYPVWGALLQQT